jgi:hypothetical protein
VREGQNSIGLTGLNVPPPLATALAALDQHRLPAMDNQAKTIQTKSASANAGTKQQTRVSP